jgi:hypothetical protein
MGERGRRDRRRRPIPQPARDGVAGERHAATAAISWVQKGQRVAPTWTSERHNGHLPVRGSGVGSVRIRVRIAFIGLITAKKMTAAMIRNEINALRKAP